MHATIKEQHEQIETEQNTNNEISENLDSDVQSTDDCEESKITIIQLQFFLIMCSFVILKLILILMVIIHGL